MPRAPRVSTQPARVRGKRRGLVAFKPDSALEEYLRTEATIQGWSLTSVVLDMLTTQRDIEESLGDDWWEIERLANVERIGKGTVIARLALEGLRHRSPSKK